MEKNTEYTTFNDCFSYEKFSNFGWESAYQKHIIRMIQILGTHNDVSRLFLLVHIDLSNNDEEIIINKLQVHKINPSIYAIKLANDLKELLPNADPIYVELVGEVYENDYGGLFKLLEAFTMQKKNYPRIQRYNQKVTTLNTINSLTINFKVDQYLRMCPDPEKYFNSIKFNSSQQHFHESVSYLAERYEYQKSMVYLICTLQTYKYNLTKTAAALDNDPTPDTTKKMRRFACDINYVNFKNTTDLSFLKELAYIKHKDEIHNFIENEKSIRQKKIAEAKASGQLKFCECCYNDELLDSEVHCCPANHYFCSSCIKQGSEVALSNGKLDVRCFSDCDEEINLSVIKELIDDKLYQRVISQRQVREIKTADIEGLESCEFCDFCIILPPESKSIKCLNPECYKETCRQCREQSHFPLKCDEIEGNLEKRFRIMVENKLNELLMRTCFNCKRTFVKTGGCNKMTCVCGKQMCYLCKEPILALDYQHFEFGSAKSTKCPLYTNTFSVYENAVNEATKQVVDDLRMKKSEILEKIDINRIILELKNSESNTIKSNFSKPVEVIEIIDAFFARNNQLRRNNMDEL